MVNWQDPTTVYLCARALVLITHISFGVYLWEFLTSFDFDILYIKRRRKLGLGSSVYFLARYTTLAALAVALRIANVFEPINCKASLHGCMRWRQALRLQAGMAFAKAARKSLSYASVAFSSLLLYMRVYAIIAVSGSKRPIAVFLGMFYSAYLGTIVYGSTQARFAYIPELYICAPTRMSVHRLNVIVQFAFDLTSLVVMSYSLLKAAGGGPGSLWRVVFSQGAVWMLVVTAAYLLAVILLILELNDPLAEIPNEVALLVLTICATRMQRGLINFVGERRNQPWVRAGCTDVTSSMEIHLPTVASQDSGQEAAPDSREVLRESKSVHTGNVTHVTLAVAS
ncbi:hypothetical protein AURDEDRAFT_164845 [Auricularia subglabra TFB-10046 SS5]|nr:hypothetical protein AURDEDRAFT_164845 [Auricularia subglabra TFB-10046 SS5]